MDRRQTALECVKVEKGGGCVLDFLRERGCISPWGTWYRLQKEELHRTEAQITDGKGEKKMKQVKITDEQKAEAVRIAIDGGDPRPYLLALGSKAPDTMWQAIRQKVRDEDPETYEKIPARIPQQRKKRMKKEKIEPRTEPEATEERRFLKAIVAEGLAGRWTTDGETIALADPDTLDEWAEMTVDTWEMAMMELPAVLHMFGLEA